MFHVYILHFIKMLYISHINIIFLAVDNRSMYDVKINNDKTELPKKFFKVR